MPILALVPDGGAVWCGRTVYWVVDGVAGFFVLGRQGCVIGVLGVQQRSKAEAVGFAMGAALQLQCYHKPGGLLGGSQTPCVAPQAPSSTGPSTSGASSGYDNACCYTWVHTLSSHVCLVVVVPWEN